MVPWAGSLKAKRLHVGGTEGPATSLARFWVCLISRLRPPAARACDHDSLAGCPRCVRAGKLVAPRRGTFRQAESVCCSITLANLDFPTPIDVVGTRSDMPVGRIRRSIDDPFDLRLSAATSKGAVNTTQIASPLCWSSPALGPWPRRVGVTAAGWPLTQLSAGLAQTETKSPARPAAAFN